MEESQLRKNMAAIKCGDSGDNDQIACQFASTKVGFMATYRSEFIWKCIEPYSIITIIFSLSPRKKPLLVSVICSILLSSMSIPCRTFAFPHFRFHEPEHEQYNSLFTIVRVKSYSFHPIKYCHVENRVHSFFIEM